ncbi:MAG: LamG-like jellyroll fold domain-containing protein [Akkermansiaceae bacterium]
MKFSHLDPKVQGWVDDYLDGTIQAEDFEQLQDAMLEDAELRRVMRRYLSLDHHLSVEASEQGDLAGSEGLWSVLPEPTSGSGKGQGSGFQSLVPLAAAAVVAFILGSAVMHWGSSRERPLAGNENPVTTPLNTTTGKDSFAEGFAVVENLFDVSWKDSQKGFSQGEVLGSEAIFLATGTMELQFFSGALMTLEGPAEVSLKSAWEAHCQEGAVRMKVPPAARGFKLYAPTTEIVDLGTEFGLVVRDGEGKVEVFDGEIAVRHQGGDEQLIQKGGALALTKNGPTEEIEEGSVQVPDLGDFGDRARSETIREFESWREHRDVLARDQRLLAYYGFDRDPVSLLVPNLTTPRNKEFDGAVVMAESVSGRWPGLKSALEFRRPGSRVRVNIPGEFPAFTFMCWVRIDSLDRQYNALFMGDGYETGEPHWQIRDDGKMMLSIMVDDQGENPYHKGAHGFHRVYFSPSMWDLSMSGQWLHLTSVFDPKNRKVSHYVNGNVISEEVIESDYLIDRLRIGNAEIGNWGQPFREDPVFAIRNLNGRMDELMIFKAALTSENIVGLYERSRSRRR